MEWEWQGGEWMGGWVGGGVVGGYGRGRECR